MHEWLAWWINVAVYAPAALIAGALLAWLATLRHALAGPPLTPEAKRRLFLSWLAAIYVLVGLGIPLAQHRPEAFFVLVPAALAAPFIVSLHDNERITWRSALVTYAATMATVLAVIALYRLSPRVAWHTHVLAAAIVAVPLTAMARDRNAHGWSLARLYLGVLAALLALISLAVVLDDYGLSP